MADGKLDEHTLETYKGLLELGRMAINTLFLLNGGAAVALLAYLGSERAAAETSDLAIPMGAFLLGLTAIGACVVVAYKMQLTLFQEGVSNAPEHAHQLWLNIAMSLAALSVACFAAGALAAVIVLT